MERVKHGIPTSDFELRLLLMSALTTLGMGKVLSTGELIDIQINNNISNSNNNNINGNNNTNIINNNYYNCPPNPHPSNVAAATSASNDAPSSPAPALALQLTKRNRTQNSRIGEVRPGKYSRK